MSQVQTKTETSKVVLNGQNVETEVTRYHSRSGEVWHTITVTVNGVCVSFEECIEKL